MNNTDYSKYAYISLVRVAGHMLLVTQRDSKSSVSVVTDKGDVFVYRTLSMALRAIEYLDRD